MELDPHRSGLGAGTPPDAGQPPPTPDADAGRAARIIARVQVATVIIRECLTMLGRLPATLLTMTDTETKLRQSLTMAVRLVSADAPGVLAALDQADERSDVLAQDAQIHLCQILTDIEEHRFRQATDKFSLILREHSVLVKVHSRINDVLGRRRELYATIAEEARRHVLGEDGADKEYVSILANRFARTVRLQLPEQVDKFEETMQTVVGSDAMTIEEVQAALVALRGTMTGALDVALSSLRIDMKQRDTTFTKHCTEFAERRTAAQTKTKSSLPAPIPFLNPSAKTAFGSGHDDGDLCAERRPSQLGGFDCSNLHTSSQSAFAKRSGAASKRHRDLLNGDSVDDEPHSLMRDSLLVISAAVQLAARSGETRSTMSVEPMRVPQMIQSVRDPTSTSDVLKTVFTCQLVEGETSETFSWIYSVFILKNQHEMEFPFSATQKLTVILPDKQFVVDTICECMSFDLETVALLKSKKKTFFRALTGLGYAMKMQVKRKKKFQNQAWCATYQGAMQWIQRVKQFKALNTMKIDDDMLDRLTVFIDQFIMPVLNTCF